MFSRMRFGCRLNIHERDRCTHTAHCAIRRINRGINMNIIITSATTNWFIVTTTVVVIDATATANIVIIVDVG